MKTNFFFNMSIIEKAKQIHTYICIPYEKFIIYNKNFESLELQL